MIQHFAARHFRAKHFLLLYDEGVFTPVPPIPTPIPPGHGGSGGGGYSGGAGYFRRERRERVEHLVEQAYRRVLKEHEPAVRKIVRKYIPDAEVREDRELEQRDYRRISADVDLVRALLEELQMIMRAAEITAAMEALIAYEIALDDDEMAILLLMA